ncbi:MAG: histidine kinase [Rikenellaceae bacterium]|jgi:signal transduction histidine kinase|nr:histidine kinase [Rikenellaceae bacterium]
MVLQILLIISIALQLVAAVTAISLTRMTRYNLSWILFTIAFTAMCFLRLGEYAQVVLGKEWRLPPDFFVWIGVLTSLCFAVGVFYVKKIFNLINRLDSQRRLTEKRILNTVVRTEEKERMRFAKELHDGLGPLLSSAKMSLSALAHEGQSKENLEIIGNMNYVMEEAIRSLREISNNLSPHVLNDFGLRRGVENFIGKSLASGTMKIDFRTNLQGERFDTDVEVILYRVICELINNSLKHSGGQHVAISLVYADQVLLLDYSDDGRGFNPQAVMDIGMGLQNINSRINSLKGSVQITSAKGEGMHARIEIDLRKTTEWKRPRK